MQRCSHVGDTFNKPPPVSPAVLGMGYGLSFCAAAMGITFIGLGLGGELTGRAGQDPMEVMNSYGIIPLLYTFVLLFAARLLFWPKAPAAIRRITRATITATFLIGVPLSALSFIMSVLLPPATKDAAFPLVLSTLTLLCQTGSLLWLIRYRRHGL